ncbi:MAG TPA: EpsI family protein [bacterium]|nr:EpsI family protein [bacterium]
MSGWRYALSVATLVAAAVASEVLIGQGVSLRVPLDDLPYQLSVWRGHAEPIDAMTVDRTRPDQMINRRYTDATGHSLMLYVAYYAREATRGQALSVCAVCDVLATGVDTAQIDGVPLTFNRGLIREDGTESVVLYWYQIGGRAVADPYRGKFAQTVRALQHHRSEGALIRVTAPLVGSEQDTQDRAVAFVKTLFPLLRRHFPD